MFVGQRVFNSEISILAIGRVHRDLYLFRLSLAWRWNYFVDDSRQGGSWAFRGSPRIEIQFRYSRGPGGARFGHSLGDAGARVLVRFFVRFPMSHGAMLTPNEKSCRAISHSFEKCLAAVLN